MEIFKEWLQNNGYRFSVEPFGITFKHQGGNFIIGNNTGDNSYLQILMPGVYTLNNPSEKQHGLEVCNELNKEIKCIKAFFFMMKLFGWLQKCLLIILLNLMILWRDCLEFYIQVS